MQPSTQVTFVLFRRVLNWKSTLTYKLRFELPLYQSFDESFSVWYGWIEDFKSYHGVFLRRLKAEKLPSYDTFNVSCLGSCLMKKKLLPDSIPAG